MSEVSFVVLQGRFTLEYGTRFRGISYWTRLCNDLDVIAHTIARRISQFLEKAGYLVRDAHPEYLDLMQDEEGAMGAIVGASITYRLAFGPNTGRKADRVKAPCKL